MKSRKLYWLLGHNSELSLNNKLLVYKAILKPIWTYGLELWGTASNSNIEIIQRFQSKTLRMITKAPWYIRNDNIHKDLNMRKVKDEIKRKSNRHLNRLSNHSNVEAICLLDESHEVRRLKRHQVLYLSYR